jgi:hypothetical protein
MGTATSSALPFFTGRAQPYPTPLARFLPQLQHGVVSAWLDAHVPRGSVVIDPFGASPHLAVEAARAGYRVIVAANNPIARFLIELAAQPPSAEDLQGVLAELAATRRGDERLEPHILNLYATTCENCAGTVFAERFLWEENADAPYAKEYTCPHCHASGEFAANEIDKENARKYSGGGPNRARALERVAQIDSPDRPFAEEALNAYPPRAVYALFTLLNKFSGLALNEAQTRQLFPRCCWPPATGPARCGRCVTRTAARCN